MFGSTLLKKDEFRETSRPFFVSCCQHRTVPVCDLIRIVFEGSLRFLHHWRILNKHRVTDFQIRWFYIVFIVSVVFHFLFLLEVARAEFDRSRQHVGDLGNFDVHGTSEERRCRWYTSCTVWRGAIIPQETMHL